MEECWQPGDARVLPVAWRVATCRSKRHLALLPLYFTAALLLLYFTVAFLLLHFTGGLAEGVWRMMSPASVHHLRLHHDPRAACPAGASTPQLPSCHQPNIRAATRACRGVLLWRCGVEAEWWWCAVAEWAWCALRETAWCALRERAHSFVYSGRELTPCVPQTWATRDSARTFS